MPAPSGHRHYLSTLSMFRVLESVFLDISRWVLWWDIGKGCMKDCHGNEVLKLKSLTGNQTKGRHPVSSELSASMIFFFFSLQKFPIPVSLCPNPTSQHRVCIGKLIFLTSPLLSVYAPYQFHPNNLQISFGFIYSHCCYFEALPTAAWHSTLDAFLGFFLSIKCFQKQNFGKWVHRSWLRSESFSKEVLWGKYCWLSTSNTEFQPALWIWHSFFVSPSSKIPAKE